MSEEAQDEGVTIAEDGIAVRKRFEPEQFSAPAIVFELASTRDDPVLLRVVDRLQGDISIDDVGFHPDYGSEHWTASEERIVFEYRLDPGEEYTTVYGVRDDEFDGTLTEFEVRRVESPPEGASADGGAGAISEIVPEERSEVVREVISGERTTFPGLGDDEPAAGEADASAAPETAEAEAAGADTAGTEAVEAETAEAAAAAEASTGEADAAAEGQAAAEPASADETAAAGGAGTVAVEGSLVAAIADEIRAGHAPEEDVDLLFETLGGPTPSTESRIDHLQSEVSDLSAYTSALEEFIDENGTARQLLDDLEGRVDDLREAVEDAEERIATNADAAADLEADVDEVHEAVADLEEEVSRLDDAEDELRSAVEARLDDLESSVSSLDEDVELIKQWGEGLAEVFGDPVGGGTSDDGDSADGDDDTSADADDGDGGDGDEAGDDGE